MDNRKITPLIKIENPHFATHYDLGLWWALDGEEQDKGVSPDSYLVNHLKKDVRSGGFDPLSEYQRAHIGFYFGMIHGSIVSPLTRTVRPDAKTLITFTKLDSRWGYNAGRRAYFKELSPRERIPTDTLILEGLCELVQSNRESLMTDNDQMVYWWTGDILGNLSGQLFPATQEDFLKWKRRP